MSTAVLPLHRFAGYRDIASAIAGRLAEARAGRTAFEPWTEEVIVPSRGLADAIARELLQRIPVGIAGLRLQTLEELAKRLLNESGAFPRVASEGERRLAMRTAVRAIDHPMIDGRGIAAMMERSYRDVRDSGLTLADVRASRTRNPERTRLVLRAWNDYERLIKQLNAIDPSDLFNAPPPKDRTFILAGFYDMTGVQLRFTRALRDAGCLSAIYIPVDPSLPFAQRLVRELELDGDGSVPSKANARVLAYDTREDELRGTCAEVAALLRAGVDAREIGIVARSFEPYDARLLHRFANEYGFSTTIDDGLPLTAHRIGRAAVTLLRLRDRGFPRMEVLELVRDGLKTKTRINADAADAETRLARVAGGTSDELRTLRRRKPPVDDYINLVAELEQLTLSLDATQLPNLFHLETEQDLQAAEALDEIATLFQHAKVWNRSLDHASIIDAIEQVTLEPLSVVRSPLSVEGGERTTDNGQHPTVWSGPILKFRGRTFKHLFALKLQDDLFPQRRTEDPLLPDSDRATLGIRQIGDGKDEEQLLFQLLFDSSEELALSYAAGDGFGKVLRGSRFLRGCPLSVARCPSPAPGQRTTDNGQRPLQLIARAGTASAFDGYIGPAARIARALDSLSPTQLEDFGECPHKFLLKHVLGVVEFDAPERELQIHHREKGSIDHAILERLYRELSPEDFGRAAAALPRLPDELTQRLDAIIDAEFERLASINPPFNRTVREMERRATKRNLRDFLAHDLADLHANGLTPRHFEFRFGAKWRARNVEPERDEPFVVEMHGTSLRVEGSIDRIDTDGNRYRVVDYKSGKAFRHQNLGDKIDRGVRLQLPLYAMAVSEFFGTPNVDGTIKPLVIGEGKPKFGFTLAEKREGILETLSIFVDAIRRGLFPAVPNDEDFGSCKYCPVNHSCRTKHDAEERREVERWRDARTLLGGGGGER